MNNEDYTIGSAGGFINAKHAKPRVQKVRRENNSLLHRGGGDVRHSVELQSGPFGADRIGQYTTDKHVDEVDQRQRPQAPLDRSRQGDYSEGVRGHRPHVPR